MSVLVTGAGGFLGARLVERLSTAGHEVIAIGRSAVPRRIASLRNVAWIQRDIAQDGLSPMEIAGIESVCHLAGATGGAPKDEWGFLSANEVTTVRVLQACAEKVKRFVYASSQVVYGNPNCVAVNEEFPLSAASTAYACSKINGENWLKWFQQKHGGLYIALRFCGFVEGGGIVHYIADQALRNEPIELHSGGKVRRDYLPVEKGIDAFVAALSYAGTDEFLPINIGSGQAVSSLELAEIIRAELGSSSRIVLSPQSARQGDFVFDINRAMRCLGFSPGDLPEAVRKYVKEIRASPKRGVGNA